MITVDNWQATGIRLGTVLQSFSSVVTGVVIAFVYSWEFALFILGLAPFFIVASFLEMKMIAGFSGTEALEGAGQVSILSATCNWPREFKQHCTPMYFSLPLRTSEFVVLLYYFHRCIICSVFSGHLILDMWLFSKQFLGSSIATDKDQ